MHTDLRDLYRSVSTSLAQTDTVTDFCGPFLACICLTDGQVILGSDRVVAEASHLAAPNAGDEEGSEGGECCDGSGRSIASSYNLGSADFYPSTSGKDKAASRKRTIFVTVGRGPYVWNGVIVSGTVHQVLSTLGCPMRYLMQKFDLQPQKCVSIGDDDNASVLDDMQKKTMFDSAVAGASPGLAVKTSIPDFIVLRTLSRVPGVVLSLQGGFVCDVQTQDLGLADVVGHTYITAFTSPSVQAAVELRPASFTVASESAFLATEEVLQAVHTRFISTGLVGVSYRRAGITALTALIVLCMAGALRRMHVGRHRVR
eukprot:6451735-Amphidinium_carterae.2